MPRPRRSIAALAAVAVVLLAGLAHADPVADLILVIEKQPAGMERDAWREARRDAARKLGQAGDRRAVPVLIKVVRDEPFDAIGEIAVEALGRLGDPSAIAVLKEVVDDPSRDRFVRTAAEQALRQLGQAEPASDDTAAPTATSDRGEPASDGAAGPDQPPRGPRFDDDVVAATEHLTFALGGLRLAYDTVQDRPSLDGDVAAAYERSDDRTDRGFRYGGTGSLVAGAIDYPGDNSSSKTMTAALGGHGEARFYPGGGAFYALGGGAADLTLSYAKVRRPGNGASNDTSIRRLGADVDLGLFVGRGRTLELGEAIRLRRLEQALERGHALGRPITPDLAERVLALWWALRDEQGLHRRLTATVALLREAGVLLGEPDASLTYQLLAILGDGQLDHRPSGLDVAVGFGESYLVRDASLGVDDGRFEDLLSRASYGLQRADGRHELVGTGSARYRVLAGSGAAAPWAAQAALTYRRYVYGEWSDPLGALELGGELGASSDGLMGSRVATRIAGRLGWLWSPARASQFRLAADLRDESGELFVGASFAASYGLLDTSFVSRTAYGAL